jgi:hypothetical protein
VGRHHNLLAHHVGKAQHAAVGVQLKQLVHDLQGGGGRAEEDGAQDVRRM